MSIRKLALLTLLLVLPASAAFMAEARAASDAGIAENVLERPINDDVIYFVLPDRFSNGDTGNDTGGFGDGKLTNGFDPRDKAFYHGGDLRGLVDKLDYLADLGVSAIWMAPIFKNKPVQADANGTSAGYHGYWITDFTRIDPHLGSNEDLKRLVTAAHERGIKVFFDIIANHTADVIKYRQCDDPGYKGADKEGSGNACVYRTKAEYPYTTLGDAKGSPINKGFAGDDIQTEENFAKLTDPRWAYFPYVAKAEKSIKVPAWLNDPIFYHNRGESTYSGENSTYGDFVSLDDLFTEHPRVVSGMIDIYKFWIREFRIDGFRVDTVKHVNIGFWQRFVPAIKAYATEQGIPDFFVFGEVYDSTPEFLSTYTTEGKLPAVLDFGFQGAVASFVSTPKPSDELRDFFAKDDYYIDADSDAYTLPTFIGNHDMGRIGHFIEQGLPGAGEAEQLERSRLAHALMYFARGVPVVYYGDEQGFTGDGADQDAREDMFPSAVASYNDNHLIGSDATTANDNFTRDQPLYQALRRFAEIRRAHPALRRGVQIHRYSSPQPGIYAFSRIDPAERSEYVLAFNNDTQAHSARFETAARGTFRAVYPDAAAPLSAQPQLELTVPALDFVIYKADNAFAAGDTAPAVRFTNPLGNGLLIRDQFITAELDQAEPASVAFEVKIGEGDYQPLGRDTNPPYRVFFKTSAYPDGTTLRFRATAGDYAGRTSTAEAAARVDTRLPHVTLRYQNGNARDSVYALASTGAILFPRPFKENTLEFDWPGDAEGMTVIFETRDGKHFRLDRPLYLSLANDVMPLARERDGKLIAMLHINNDQRISESPQNAQGLPASLPADAAPDPPLSAPVYVRGGMNAWRAEDELTYVGNYTYHRQVVLAADDIEFKFADANWQDINIGAPVGRAGANRGSNPGNLRITVPKGQGGLYDIHFFAFPTPAASYYFYRIEKATTPFERTLYLRGSLAGSWDARDENAFVYQGDKLYTLERILSSGAALEFKIADADESSGTNFGLGKPASVALDRAVTLTDGGGNAKVSLEETARYRLTLDAGDLKAPTLTITRIGEADIGPYDKVLYLRGGMNEWAAPKEAGFGYDGNNRYSLVATLPAGSYEFKIADADWTSANLGAAANDEGTVSLSRAKTLARGDNPGNLKITLPDSGAYVFRLDASNADAPVLTVTK